MSDADEDRRRPVLLGEAPSKSGDRYSMFPLSGRPARVLCELAGIPPQPDGTTYGRWTWALYDHFDCRNVFERYAAATPWSAPRAREAVRPLLAELRGVEDDHVPPAADVAPAVIVCLGRRVQAAVFGALEFRIVRTGRWASGVFGDFGSWAAPWHIETPFVPAGESEPVHRWAPWVVTIPHPSGLNRQLNDESERAKCGEVLRRALELNDPPRRQPRSVADA